MKCYGVTDKGLVRSTNQDSYIISANTNDDILAIVCDGIGGGKGGDVASTMATDYLGDIFSKTHGFADLKQAKDFVRYHITRINFQIYTYAQTHTAFKGMGTTLTALFSGSVGKFVINIGDSRVYGYTAESGLKSLTVDHTWVMDMYRAGTLSLEEAKNHPKKNVITNALACGAMHAWTFLIFTKIIKIICYVLMDYMVMWMQVPLNKYCNKTVVICL